MVMDVHKGKSTGVLDLSTNYLTCGICDYADVHPTTALVMGLAPTLMGLAYALQTGLVQLATRLLNSTL